MSDERKRPRRRARKLAMGRLEALIDGVFAIAITLLAIEVSVPIVESTRGADLWEALVDQWPSYAAYTVTFFLIGAYWLNHHRMFNLLRGIDHTFLILNILFLMAIAIVPFPNAVLAEYMLEEGMREVAVIVYGLAMTALAVAFNVVWWYAGWRMRLLKKECDPGRVKSVLRSYLVGPALYATAILVAFISSTVALVIVLLIPLGYLFEGPVGKLDVGYIEVNQ